MHFQKKFIKGIAIMLSALMLTISITNTNTIPVYAAGASAELTLTKVIDMALTKTGVIANNNWLQKVQASFLNMLNGTASSYGSYCEANGLEKNNESWVQYSTSDAYVNSEFYFANWILQLTHFVDWVITGVEADDEIALQVLADTSKCVQGETYTLKDEAVEFVRDTFDDIVADEGLGYYYVPVFTATDLDIRNYATLESYNNAKSYINGSDHITIIRYSVGTNYGPVHFRYLSNEHTVNLVHSGGCSKLFFYNSDWTESDYAICYYTGTKVDGYYQHDIDFYDTESFLAKYTDRVSSISDCYLYKDSYLPYDTVRFYSKHGGYVIVYESLEMFKNYNGGNKPVYRITSDSYDPINDNTLTYTGDYIINNGSNYSYETIQNTIDNSVDNSTDGSVTTIVNDSYNTIINNYYYTDPGSGDGGGGSGDSGNDSSGGGLGSLIDGIGSILNFVVTLIGDLIGLIGGFLDTVYDLLKNLGSNFTNFSNLLGELFSFIPQELIDLIGAGIGVMIAVALIRMLKG